MSGVVTCFFVKSAGTLVGWRGGVRDDLMSRRSAAGCHDLTVFIHEQKRIIG